jgi:hypothetical protein
MGASSAISRMHRALGEQEVRPGVDQRAEVLDKTERAQNKEDANAAAHAFVRWLEELDVLQ